MSRTIFELDFKDHRFRFFQTKDSKDLINHIFGDNYGVFSKEVEFSDGDVIFDAGANEGMFSIMMAKLFPQAQIFAFEPVGRTLSTLLDNLALNEINNVHVFKCAIGKENGAVILNISKDHSGGSSGVIGFNPKDHVQEEVQVYSLNHLMKMFSVEKVKLLKMDIEGMEYDALYNSDIEKIDYFAGEIHHNAYLSYNNSHPQMLVNWLTDRTTLLGVEVCKMSE